MAIKSYRVIVVLTTAAILLLFLGHRYRRAANAYALSVGDNVRSRWHQQPFKQDLLSSATTPHLFPSSLNTSSLRAVLQPHIQDGHFRYACNRIRVEQGTLPDDPFLPSQVAAFAPQWTESVDMPDSPGDSTFSDIEADELILTLPIPNLPPHKPRIFFGLATDVERLRENQAHMRHWMTHPGTSALAIVPPHDEAEKLQAKWRKLGIDITIQQSAMPFFDRLLTLVPAMKSLDATTKITRQYSSEWFIILDDDTFVPSVPRLASTLAAYDHKRPFYIGGLSEPRMDLNNMGMLAFGGAGMVLSSALIAQLAPRIPECMKTGTQDWGGDVRLAECVMHYTQTRMTYVRELHQMTLTGDQAGMYESGFKPATLHHWKGWAEVPMDRVAKVASITGDEGLFQRWRFADGWVLSNGFSLVQYPSLAKSPNKLGARQVKGPLVDEEWEGDLGGGGNAERTHQSTEDQRQQQHNGQHGNAPTSGVNRSQSSSEEHPGHAHNTAADKWSDTTRNQADSDSDENGEQSLSHLGRKSRGKRPNGAQAASEHDGFEHPQGHNRQPPAKGSLESSPNRKTAGKSLDDAQAASEHVGNKHAQEHNRQVSAKGSLESSANINNGAIREPGDDVGQAGRHTPSSGVAGNAIAADEPHDRNTRNGGPRNRNKIDRVNANDRNDRKEQDRDSSWTGTKPGGSPPLQQTDGKANEHSQTSPRKSPLAADKSTSTAPSHPAPAYLANTKEGIDFSLTELTWDNGAARDFEHTLGPFRPKMPPEEKLSWLFVDSVTVGEDGEDVERTGGDQIRRDVIVKQIYLRKAEQGGTAEVIELMWSR